ncbi:general substrate transporter [Saccharata proteae CBS 121410]|uniref:General substrate transporter n=1 Tax=Saccharata proteae CBS 121410 TaxID=1314787 RepID=A0A9P4LUC1_9PEZI|nr:general substrate transporter [Saccharata proteae CBS 121410]
MAPFSSSTNKNDSVGDDLAAVLPRNLRPWYRQSHLLRLNFSLFSLFLLSSATGYDGTLMNGLQSLDQWQIFMNQPTGAWLGFINAMTALGSISQYSIVAWATNRYGRKWTPAVGFVWLILGVGLQAGARNPAMFIMGRLFVGCTTAWFSGPAPLLITETAYPTHRGVATALFQTGWYVGSTIAAWTTFGSRNYGNSWAWRIPSICQLAVPAAAFTGWLLAPESPRWLISQGRIEEARAFFTKYHAGGDPDAPIVSFELNEVRRTLDAEREATASASYLDMVKTKGNRHRLFISITLGIFAQWNGIGIVSYYLSSVLDSAGITSETEQTIINGCLQMWNLIIAVAAAFLVDKAGRRPLFLTSCLVMLASYIAISGLSGSFYSTGNSATGLAVLPMLFVYYAGYDIAFTPLLISYPCEIWPFALRSRGLVVSIFTTQLGLFFNTFVNPIAMDAIHWKYYVIFAVLLVFVTLTCYFFYPETKGYSLEEIARVFDGEAVDVRTDTSTEKVAHDSKESHVEKRPRSRKP